MGSIHSFILSSFTAQFRFKTLPACVQFTCNDYFLEINHPWQNSQHPETDRVKYFNGKNIRVTEVFVGKFSYFPSTVEHGNWITSRCRFRTKALPLKSWDDIRVWRIGTCIRIVRVSFWIGQSICYFTPRFYATKAEAVLDSLQLATNNQ